MAVVILHDIVTLKAFVTPKLFYSSKLHWPSSQGCPEASGCDYFARVGKALTTRVILKLHTVYPKKYALGFCVAVLCCGYTLTDFPISIRLTSLALWQSNDCPSASKETLMNMDKYCMWIHYERLHNHNKAKHNKTVCIFLGIYCSYLEIYCIKDPPRQCSKNMYRIVV